MPTSGRSSLQVLHNMPGLPFEDSMCSSMVLLLGLCAGREQADNGMFQYLFCTILYVFSVEGISPQLREIVLDPI